MNSLQDDLDAIAAELAPLLAMGYAQDKGATAEEREKHAWLAEWLVRIHSPQEIAMLALAASETVQKIKNQIGPIVDGIESLTKLHEDEIIILKAVNTGESKIAVWNAKQDARKELARKGAKAALQRSPKQVAKLMAFNLWNEWQTGKHNFRTGAEFARYVLEKFPGLKSQKVIEGWVTGWRRASKSK